MNNKTPLSVAIAMAVAGITAAAGSAAQAQTEDVTEIRVTALGVTESADLIVAPFSVLDSDELLSRGGTLGDLLNGLTGVHADSFGGGSSRPVIRGQTTPRTKVLSDGSNVLDASDVSPDHAVAVDPILAQRVEVLRGPATLLYGGGAIGGVVNVLDDKIPSTMPGADGGQTYDGFVALRGNTVANERAGAISLTSRATDNIAVHFETSMVKKDDYEAPNWDEARVEGTFADSNNSSVGASWIGERGFIGLSYSYRKDDYGIPGHSEEFGDCHPHGDHLHCEGHDDHDEDVHDDDHEEHDDDHDDHGDEHDHEHGVPFIDLTSKRVDLRGELLAPLPGINKVRFRASNTDYEHYEIEDEEVGSAFFNKGYEARIEFDHASLMGWQGLFGVQVSDTEFSSQGESPFLPTIESEATGVFVVEHFQLSDAWHLEAGARYDRQKHRPVNDPRGRPAFSDSASSWSGSAIWEAGDGIILSATYASAQRLPHAQELYSRGIHVATNTFECGLIPDPLTCGGLENNQPLRKESADNIELGLRKVTGPLTYSFNLFRNNVDNYIYARTLDQYEDFRLVKYTQRDAEFTGYEAELAYRFNDNFAAEVFSDYVRVGLDDTADRLPRIPPRRYGVRLDAQVASRTSAELEVYRSAEQKRTAAFENGVDDYDMVNLSVSHSFDENGRYNLFLRASNLLDEEVRNASSFLADVIPMPGRNVSAGFKLDF
ncbi:MAG: TonB-dependent receptor [Pseudomonadota bacterium]|nr:TonB-dependent receptor [Pseudomonadota bacterium]